VSQALPPALTCFLPGQLLLALSALMPRNWHVAEAFIGSDYLKTSRYKEFQVSPRGEFVDLDIVMKTPDAADELRLGLFRIEGPEPKRVYVAWRATGATTFHVPGAFGSLVLR
jgi:hypothetical protein